MTTASERRLSDWVEHAPIAMFSVDGRGRYLDGNPAALAMVGYTLEALKALDITRVVAPEDLPRAAQEFQVLVDRGALDASYELVRQDGSRVAVAMRAVRVADDTFVGFCQDISAQRAAERERELSRARLADVVRSMSDWAWEVDAQGRYTWVSGAVERFLGYTPQEVLGKTPFDLMPPEEAARVGAAFAALLEARAPLVALQNVNRHQDGHLVHLETSGVPVLGPGGELLGYRGADRDVTERLKHLEELTQARDAAEAGARAKSHFLATVSHELRTPLNGVLGMAQLLELSELDAAQRDDLATLQSSANSLLGLIDDVLDYSRLEAGRVPSQVQVFRPRELLEAVAWRLRPQAFQGVSLSIAVDDSVPQTLVGDEVHLARVVEQLVENAFKFTHQGTVAISARCRDRQGDVVQLELQVKDSGIGMTPEVLAQLFEPFTQGDSSATRAYGGLGLGLTVCKHLAELMGARLDASSTPGVGSVMTLLAPLGLGMATGQSPLPRPAGRGLEVLLAEDHAINRRYAEALLRRLGHRVHSVGDGREALAAMERQRWDVVLMDLQMPRCTGQEAVERLRAREAQAGGFHQPVLAVTAWAREDERAKLLRAGFDGLVPKPFDARQLLRELEAAGVGAARAAG